MQAIRIHRFGGAEVLSLDEIDKPRLHPGEALIRIQGAGVNPVDLKIRSGGFPRVTEAELPVTLGREVSGVVEIGPPAHALCRPGAEIFASLPWGAGGYAGYVALPAELCVPKPGKLDGVASGAVPLAGLTAWQGLFDHGQLARGQSVLIHAAAGGVGHFAVQFAKLRGARVLATASAGNLEFVRALGADVVVDYRQQAFEDVARDMDLVFDLIGGETQSRSWSVLKRGGRLVSTVGPPDAAQAARHGVRGVGYMAEPNPAQLGEIGALIDAGRVALTVTRILALADAATAHEELESRHPRGKLVLAVGRAADGSPAA